MDILSEALASMRTGQPVSVRTTGHTPWAVSLPPVSGSGFHVVLSGACWLIPLDSDPGSPAPQGEPGGDDGLPRSVHLREGDVVFLRDGCGAVLADHPDTPPQQPREAVFAAGAPLGTVTVGDGGGDGERADLLAAPVRSARLVRGPADGAGAGLGRGPGRPGGRARARRAARRTGPALDRPGTGRAGRALACGVRAPVHRAGR